LSTHGTHLLSYFHYAASALADLTIDDLASGFQLNAKNTLIGLEDRINLIQHVTETMKDYSNIFSGNDKSSSRPGNMLGKYLFIYIQPAIYYFTIICQTMDDH
jgi:hypothetical protein